MKKAIFSPFLIAICVFPVLAQQAVTSTLSGRVTDPNGAVVVGVKVTDARRPAQKGARVVVWRVRVSQSGWRRLVGQRDVAGRRIRRGFASAPHDDLLGLVRGDWRPSDRDSFNFRYAIERLEDIGATKLDRAIGSASQRQKLNNDHQAVLANWVRVFTPTVVNSFSFSVNDFHNNTVPLTIGAYRGT